VGRHGSFSAADAGGVKEPWLWRARDRRLQHVELEVTTRMSSDRRVKRELSLRPKLKMDKTQGEKKVLTRLMASFEFAEELI
jgi:hypothetical protein